MKYTNSHQIKGGQKLLCVNDEGQNLLVKGSIYTNHTNKRSRMNKVYLEDYPKYAVLFRRFQVIEDM